MPVYFTGSGQKKQLLAPWPRSSYDPPEMAKKGKRNIKALIAKRAELQALNQRSTLSIPGAPKTAPAPVELAAAESSVVASLPAHHAGREIWRTALSTAIVAAILVAVIVVDRQSPFLNRFGSQLYETLRLGN